MDISRRNWLAAYLALADVRLPGSCSLRSSAVDRASAHEKCSSEKKINEFLSCSNSAAAQSWDWKRALLRCLTQLLKLKDEIVSCRVHGHGNDSAGTSYGLVSVSVSMSVSLSQVGVLLKRMNGFIWFLACGLLSTSPTLCFKEVQVSTK